MNDQEILSAGFLLIFTIIVLIIAIIVIAGMWKVFEKAGQQGWKAIIPIYNIYILTKIAGKPGWWTLLCCIPYLNIVFIVWLYNMISKSFGKSEGFTVGLVFLGIIFWPILGFGNAHYLGPFGNQAAFHEYQSRKIGFDFENK
ncbi:MAG TPA: DUF5684 domain-containing protein [Puia sp.]|nr:DUF5684 domain-containing protein [Puia sp.]